MKTDQQLQQDFSAAVHGWDERNTATLAAWGTPGARNVADMMTLAH